MRLEGYGKTCVETGTPLLEEGTRVDVFLTSPLQAIDCEPAKDMEGVLSLCPWPASRARRPASVRAADELVVA